jgi:Ca-activated chloride channel family protein
MLFLTPQALLLGLLALPILLLYMLRLRRREVVVSSNMLWEQLLRDRQANAPWQRLKRNLLLLIQLLILCLLVLALSRPAIPVPAVASGPVIVLLDASASMNASDLSPSRFEAAKDYTRTLITNLDDQDNMTLILVGNQPVVLASAETDKDRLQAALDTAVVTQGMGAWEESFSLAAGALSSAANSASSLPTTIILSDGGLPGEQLPALPGVARYVPFGNSRDNLGISALSIRSTGNGAELFVRLSNYSAIEHTVLLSIYRFGYLFHAEQVTIPSGEHISLTITEIPNAPATFLASLSDLDNTDLPIDAFKLDDNAHAVFQPAAPGRVLLVTPGNLFMEQVLSIFPNLTPFRMLPDEPTNFTLSPGTFDLLVFDRVFPSDNALPPGNLLLINPPSNPLFEVTGTYTVTASLHAASDPLLNNIDPDTIHIAQAAQVDLPVWAKPLLYTDQGPLLFTGEAFGRRIVVFCFDLHHSDLPLQVAFPILMAQLTNYLVPPQGIQISNSLKPGDSLEIMPPLQADQVVVDTPSGLSYSLLIEGSSLIFTQTNELGLYAVNYLEEEHSTIEYFAVNLFSEQESDIQPAASISIARHPVTASPQDELSLRQLWHWFAAAALVFLLLEWWLYHGRSRLSGSNRS